MKPEDLDFVVEAKERVRKYINTSYTLTPDAELSYDIEVISLIWTRKSCSIVVSTTMPDDINYMMTYDSVAEEFHIYRYVE